MIQAAFRVSKVLKQRESDVAEREKNCVTSFARFMRLEADIQEMTAEVENDKKVLDKAKAEFEKEKEAFKKEKEQFEKDKPK